MATPFRTMPCLSLVSPASILKPNPLDLNQSRSSLDCALLQMSSSKAPASNTFSWICETMNANFVSAVLAKKSAPVVLMDTAKPRVLNNNTRS